MKLRLAPSVALVSFASVLGVCMGACNGCSHANEPPTVPAASTKPSPVERPAAKEKPAKPVTTLSPSVIARTPHARDAYTEGLVFANGELLESTGRKRESTLRRVDIATGNVKQRLDLPPESFGEGLARLKGELFQLTWRENRAYVYDEASFTLKRTVKYGGEGWGLTTDGDELLVMSDGTDAIRFREPENFSVVKTLRVKDNGRPVMQLNELEWVKGEIYANVWQTRLIVRIDPQSGEVIGRLDLSELPEPPHDDVDAVLNGIAFDEQGDRLFVTGKLWGSVFQIARPASLLP